MQPIMDKITIASVPSGDIELHFDGQQLIMQFNCECGDALPYCKAACCRYRPYYNLSLDPDEIPKFEKTINHPHDDSLAMLDHVDGNCVYLDSKACLCTVHDDKPKICGKWHCSPKGVGDGVTIRDQGWVLLPVHGDAQHADSALHELTEKS